MKKLLLIWTFLITGIFSASAGLKSWDDDPAYKDLFVQKKELWVCSSVSFPVDLAKDAFYTNYSTEIGTFEQVEPGKPTVSIGSVSGIFNVTGRPAGIYEFVFTSKINGFCGMNENQKSVVRVFLVPELIGFSSLTNLCPGDKVPVDLSQYLPYEIKNFAADMGWSVDFSDIVPASEPFIDKTGKVETSIKNIGVRTYSYTYNDDVGPFAGKFKAMNPVYKCQSKALTMHNVKVRSAEVVIPPKDISFCLSSLLNASQSKDTLVLNLKSLLGVEAKKGKWITSNEVDSHIAKVADADRGLAYAFTGYINQYTDLAPITFWYLYEGCNQVKDSSFVRVTFTNDMKADKSIRDSIKSVCRNYGSGSLDIGPYFGFSVPNSAGIWIDKNTGKVMPTGSVNLDSLKVGSLYEFSYRVNPASDFICKVPGLVADFTLRVRDAQIMSGATLLCGAQYKAGVELNLYNYVQGLSNTDLYKRSDISWELCTDAACSTTVPITGDQAAKFEVKSDMLNLGPANIGVRKLSFTYKTSDCGLSTGNLYLSVVDSIGKLPDQIIQLCYTDDLASNINLHQVLGVAGLTQGGFTSVEGNGLSTPKAGTFNQAEGVFNAALSFDKTKDKEEYDFLYKSSASTTDCITSSDAKVRVIVTKTIAVQK